MSIFHLVSAFIFAALAALTGWALVLPPSVMQAPFHIGNILIFAGCVAFLCGAVASFKEWLS